jgi:hypothetical protein
VRLEYQYYFIACVLILEVCPHAAIPDPRRLQGPARESIECLVVAAYPEAAYDGEEIEVCMSHYDLFSFNNKLL